MPLPTYHTLTGGPVRIIPHLTDDRVCNESAESIAHYCAYLHWQDGQRLDWARSNVQPKGCAHRSGTSWYVPIVGTILSIIDSRRFPDDRTDYRDWDKVEGLVIANRMSGVPRIR